MTPFDLTPSPPDFAVNWGAIDASFSWIRAMRDVPQNPLYHGEGEYGRIHSHTGSTPHLVYNQDTSHHQHKNHKPSV